MELIFFYILFCILFMSCSGYGILVRKILGFNFSINIGINSIFGIIFLTFISYILIFIISSTKYLNILIHLIGLYLFILNLKKITLSKKEIFIFIILSSCIFISKTHDDFGFYHLQQSLNLGENKLIIGLANLDFSYAYHSSLIYLNSLFYFPYYKFYFFNFFNAILLISSTLIFYKTIYDIKFEKFSRYFSLFCLTFIIIKFSRLSEFGTDLAGQIIILLCISLMLNYLSKNKNNFDDIKTIILLATYCLTIKTYFIFYLFLPLILLYFLSIYNVFKFIKLNKIFLSFIFVFLFLFIVLNVLVSGCIIFPINQLCFQQLSWAMPNSEVIAYKEWFEIWSKSLAGAGYIIENPNSFLYDFKWVKIWIKNYSQKYLETLYLLIFLSIIFLLTFRSKKKIYNKSSYRGFIILISFIIGLFLFWFFKHPTLRYGGYLIHISIFSLIISYFISSNNLRNLEFKKKSETLIIIALFIFISKNMIRINEEITTNNEYKYSNFPFFFVKKVQYNKLNLSKDFYVSNANGELCWAVNPPCGSVTKLKLRVKFNYNILERKN